VSTYVVGDVQGCLQPLQCLLREVDFSPGRDRLWSVGDLVNRGPDSLQTLRYCHALGDSLVVVLGNHDLHLLAVAAGVRTAGRSDTLADILAAPDRDELLGWLRRQPLLHREHGCTLVHAGIPPQWTLDEAAGYAREVEAALRGPDGDAFLAAMYGNEPAAWSGDLQGLDRLRVITNYLTRMRHCSADGVLDLGSKGAAPTPGAAPDGVTVAPWFSHPGRRNTGERILFGHWASLQGQTNDPDIIGLDTGCVWDGALSLYALDTGAWVRCNCRAGRCREPALR